MQKENPLNVKQTAEFLGLSERTLRRLIADRNIPFIKTNFSKNLMGEIFFSQKRLQQWRGVVEKLSRGEWKRYYPQIEDEMLIERLAELEEQELSIKIFKSKKLIVKILSGEKPYKRGDEILGKMLEMEDKLKALEEERKNDYFTWPDPEPEMEEYYKDFTGRSAMRMFRPKKRRGDK